MLYIFEQNIHMSLNTIQIQQLLKRLPPFELSYETLPHKKVFTNYEIGLAIPVGKKCFAWFSYINEHDVCYLMELNKEKKISKVEICNSIFHYSLSVGTILYGTILPIETATEDNSVKCTKYIYVIEDIFYYKGVTMKTLTFSEKLGYIESVLKNTTANFSDKNSVVFMLPYMWGLTSTEEESILQYFEKIRDTIGYPVHHLQIRKLNDIAPYLNIIINTILSKMNSRVKAVSPPIVSKPNIDIMPPHNPYLKTIKFDYNKPQYKVPTIFQVTADVQNDIYHLFAYGKNKTSIYCSIASIPNIKTSIFMNSIFRKIRENQNIDYIEESDDEEDFENIAEDKYVDLSKVVLIECVFNTKMKRWTPIREVNDNSKVVHISKLIHG